MKVSKRDLGWSAVSRFLVALGTLVLMWPSHGSLADGVRQKVTTPFDHVVFYCDYCKHEVPEDVGAGAFCPHCNAYFASATNADGSEIQLPFSDDDSVVSVRWVGVALLALIFGGQYAFRRWSLGRR